MTVEELIAELQQFDPELEVKLTTYEYAGECFDPIETHTISELNVKPQLEGWYLDIDIVPE